MDLANKWQIILNSIVNTLTIDSRIYPMHKVYLYYWWIFASNICITFELKALYQIYLLFTIISNPFKHCNILSSHIEGRNYSVGRTVYNYPLVSQNSQSLLHSVIKSLTIFGTIHFWRGGLVTANYSGCYKPLLSKSNTYINM